MVRAAQARAIEPGDPATLIGLVDSGVLLDHPELRGRLRAGANAVSLSSPQLPEGMVMLAQGHDRLPLDEEGHGTACAGIIGANGYQIAPGIAGACWMIPMKALSAVRPSPREPPTAVGSLLDIDRAVKAAIDLGARVLNLSFGTPETSLGPDDPVPHVEVVRYALERDCVLVAASGNSGDETRYFPAALPGVIAVGAVDEQRRPAPFSTMGPHVCLCAPGEGIPLAGLDGGYSEGSGTSFAAPFVTGACALMIARALRRSTPLGWATLRNLLASSASPFATGANRRGSGAGILDLRAALHAVDEACRLPPDELFSEDSDESTPAQQASVA
jgi:subtilisin family serine protease